MHTDEQGRSARVARLIEAGRIGRVMPRIRRRYEGSLDEVNASVVAFLGIDNCDDEGVNLPQMREEDFH